MWAAVRLAGGLLVKGCLQVLGHASANSPAIAGVSGLGHMLLTAAFILLFIGLGRVVRAAATGQSATVSDTPAGARPVTV